MGFYMSKILCICFSKWCRGRVFPVFWRKKPRRRHPARCAANPAGRLWDCFFCIGRDNACHVITWSHAPGYNGHKRHFAHMYVVYW